MFRNDECLQARLRGKNGEEEEERRTDALDLTVRAFLEEVVEVGESHLHFSQYGKDAKGEGILVRLRWLQREQ